MKIDRRFFIAGAASWGALACTRLFASGSDWTVRPKGNLRFGVISDIHVTLSPQDGVTLDAASQKRVEEALLFLRERSVDAVVVCGDLASFGTLRELQAVADAWNRVFPDGKRPDGGRVEKIFVMGNHDWEGWRYSGFARKFLSADSARPKDVLSSDCARNWRAVFGEEFRQFGVKTVKGYDFIQAHFIGKPDGRTKLCDVDCHRGIREFYAAYRADPRRPFFHVQHPMPRNTCYGPWGWGQDNGDSVAALSAFPQAIAFSGHSHYPISDSRAIWQGTFTSIGCGTLATPSRRVGRAGIGFESKTAFDLENNVQKASMSVMGGVEENHCGRCAMIVDVYDDNVRVTRFQMSEKLTIGDDWIIPTGGQSARPFAFAARAKTAVPPQFPAGAELTVRPVTWKNRPCVALSFPPADARKGARAYEYEVTVFAADGRKTVHRVLPPGYNGSEKGAASMIRPHCELALDRLPKSDVWRFRVCPVECFGRAGDALEKTWSTPPPIRGGGGICD